MQFAIAAFSIAFSITAPASIFAGWRRWWLHRHEFKKAWLISGIALATASALLAVTSIAYAQLIHGFDYYQPALMRIFGFGLLLPAAGLIISIGGLWIKNPARWLAPFACLSMLAFWLLMAGLE